MLLVFCPVVKPCNLGSRSKPVWKRPLAAGQTLSGLAVDFTKAFNNIRRPQWFALAQHLGLPDRLLHPWRKFLAKFTRRFQVHNNLSSALTSDVGFGEGDPMSVPAMAILDWALHVYQSQFAPLTRTTISLGFLFVADFFGLVGLGK